LLGEYISFEIYLRVRNANQEVLRFKSAPTLLKEVPRLRKTEVFEEMRGVYLAYCSIREREPLPQIPVDIANLCDIYCQPTLLPFLVS
jgi:hypothetical protein